MNPRRIDGDEEPGSYWERATKTELTDGCRCMCHSPNQPPLMVCVREGRCVLCGAQIDGPGGEL